MLLRAFASVLLVAVSLASAGRAGAGAGDPRTLVVRGRVLAPDGAPLAGARVAARGSANTVATTDERGRYSLTVPIGTAAGLRRGAFALAVHAEHAGRRLALGAGASALGIDIALAPGGGRVRVRSNSREATTALASAFARDGAATAWVEADFGGSTRPGGAPVLDAAEEVALDGSPVGEPRESATVAPAPPRPARVTPAARIAVTPAAGAVVARRGRPARAASVHDPQPPRVAVTVPPVPTPSPPSPPLATRAASAPERSEVADSCACRVRGTVEVDWERPLERDFPVELTLEGPATQRGDVNLFIGSPREFKFGPLPCGEYRLAVRSRGRVRFVLERGDSVMTIPCHGLTQARVVLVPARR